jgi:hypothetical protein
MIFDQIIAFLVYDAITQTALVSPPKISFNDTAADLYKTHTLTIDNWGEEEVIYRLHNNVSVSLMAFNKSDNFSYYSAPVAVTGSAGLTFSTDFIQVPPYTSANVSVTVDLSDETLLSSHLYYGGFIQFESQNDNYRDISVPYFGVYGRQKELPIFSPFIPLSLNDTATGTIYKNTNKKGFKFDASSNDSIIIIVSITTPTSFLKCELLDEQGQVRGYVPISDRSEIDGSVNKYSVDRNEHTELYYQFEVNSNYVPPDLLIDNRGLAEIQYKGIGYYKMSALKLFGDAQVEDDWEVWVSGPVEFV